ncbi:nuclear pore complex protein NUP1 isoform X13 [Gastrolobium bilobum]|uniref:nuclear pore complex protein NUP1 isoform X13 n=1 Tax=Gastrolobium bilobum TaxID=150636 RepID=UPI002AB104EF|nr:nuclear pore complex protein NUP1 isoform X13 [Gastrolobium bilobum]
MATARDENPYEGGGVFGKFRKRPFQRTQTTPYKRLLTALRNPSRNNGWFSKLVDPAQRLIASSANMLFASVFRKRLPPSPPPPRSSEAVQEARDNHQEAAVFYEEEQVANESSGKQQGIIVESGVQINCSDGGGLTELEKLLKQKTFTRSEIDHLTTLMRSRTVDPPVGEDGKRTEVVPSDPMLPRVQIEEYPKTPALENGIENHLVSTPYVTSSVSIDDVASPAELAKAYMGSRPSKVSQSMLGLRNPPREDPTLLRNQHFAQKSPVMSIVPRATTLARVRENGFVTPRSHGRSAIYRMARTPYARVYPISTLKGVGFVTPRSHGRSAIYRMARTPYARVYPTSTLKGVGFVTPRSHGRSAIYRMARTPYARVYPTSTLKGVGVAVEGEPSSSAQYALDHDMLSGSKQRQALKRRSSLLDNDIGSFGPIRRMPHKSNLLSSKGLTLPHSGAPLSIARNRVGIDAAQQPSSSMQKPILLGEVKHSHTKLSAKNVDDTMPSTGFPPISSKSSEMASKILQQLDNLVSPKEKSLEPRLPIMNDKSPTKLSSSMLQGQALRSMETVDSSKFLDNIRDNELGGTLGNLSASAQKLTSKIDKVENGPLKLAAPTDTDATVPRNQVVSIVKAGDSSVTNPVSYHPQKKRAFHMSAHEDYLELDDDAYPNGAVSYHPQKKRAFHLSAHEDYLELDDDAYPNGAVPYHPQKKRAFHLSAHEDYLELDDDAYPNGAVPYHPQKKRAFHLSAHEDYLELDDDAYPNGAVPSFSTWKETTGSTPVAEKTTSATETDVQEIPPASSVVLPSKSFTTDGSPPVRSADGSTFGQKFDIPTSISSSIPDPTFKPTMGAVSVAAHTILGSEKFNSQNGSVVNPPLLNFGNKVVQSTEVTAADAPSKESTKSGPIFGLDKVASSKEPGADAPLFNFGINENVDYVPQFAFSSPVGGLNFGVFSDSKMTSSIKLVSTTVPVAVDSMPKGINKNVDYVPQFAFSSPVGGLNFGVFSDSKMTSSIKLVSTTVPVAVDSMQKVLELMLMLRLI